MIGTVVVILVALVCVRLGFWQLDRLDQKRTRNHELQQRSAEPPLTGPALIALLRSDPDAATYRRVALTGTFEPQDEGLLFGRGRGEEPGHQVLTPLQLDPEHAVIVDRGFVPEDMDSVPVTQAPPPTGETTVTGVVLPAESTGGDPVSEPVVARVDIGQLQPFVQQQLLSSWIQETPAPGAPTPIPGTAPASLPEPQPIEPLNEGPHMGYAVQWFIFAIIAIVGWVVLIRRDRQTALRTPTDAPDTDRSDTQPR